MVSLTFLLITYSYAISKDKWGVKAVVEVFIKKIGKVYNYTFCCSFYCVFIYAIDARRRIFWARL